MGHPSEGPSAGFPKWRGSWVALDRAGAFFGFMALREAALGL